MPSWSSESREENFEKRKKKNLLLFHDQVCFLALNQLIRSDIFPLLFVTFVE